MSEKIYCQGGGCSAKLGAKKLSRILEKIDKYEDPDLLVGFDSHDDASVLKITEDKGIVSTLDFFPPMVEDPYLYGQIAATNALSDVYAMGGIPRTALNIVCFPDEEDLNILGRIIEGGNDKLKEAHVTLSGGHSIRDTSIKYGLSVTGIVDVDSIKTNNNAQTGDVLILTKKLGVGMTLNAMRMKDAAPEVLDDVFKSMTTLNKYAAELLKPYDVHALTDVTGFGLMVHLNEMLDHKKSAILYGNNIPYFRDCPYYVDELKQQTGNDKPVYDYVMKSEDAGIFLKQLYDMLVFLIPRYIAQTNRNSVEKEVVFEKENFFLEEIMYDPQTSGGLLASVAKKDLDDILDAFKEAGRECYVIGEVVDLKDKSIYVGE